MIAGQRAVTNLEGVESDPGPEQVGAKMKWVWLLWNDGPGDGV